MATRRTVDLLPEIFRTDTNRQFLGATLDQLTQEPNFKRTQGYVGRRYGPGVNPADNYVVEPTAIRTDYQLEPGVVFLKPETNTVLDAITYPGMIDALDLQGAITTRQDRLFESEYYSWDPFCDFDKFTNYSQYYWLAQGPESVDISGSAVPTTDAWEVSRGTLAYTFSDVAGENPTIALVRGGNYTFDVNQVGFKFWIQAAPGINGTMPGTPNISSRDVLGVENNGEDQGTITFNVPESSAQNFYYSLPSFGTVDLVTNLVFSQIDGVSVADFLNTYPTGIDGITDLEGRTLIFSNTSFDPTDLYNVWQIEYNYTNPLDPVIQLNNILTVANLSKCNISFGTTYSSTQWYKNASGYFQQVPLLTAILDTLYYQDSSNPALYGRIKLIEPGEDLVIDVDEIVGAKNYTSPNGVVFTNGLKVQFRGTANPPEFQNLEYYVEGVGTGPGLDARVGFIDGEAYFGDYHVYNGQKITGAVHSTTTFQQYIYDTVAESLLNEGAGAPVGAPLPTTGVVGATLGNGIKLLPVSEFVTPETYTKSETIPYDSTSYDSTPFDASLNAPVVQDYITINRASQDRNAWSRSNRWFHADVIRATAEYNNQDIFVDNNLRAKRPIVEFRANLNLYNFGTQGKNPVNIVDFNLTDAFSQINGQISYSTDGYALANGSRIIFATDTDPDVRNNIWQVQFIDPTNTGNFVIDLIPALDGEILDNQTVVALSGNTQQGKSYWFDGLNWITAQQKTRVNQPPLFDVYNADGVSFGNSAVYPSSTFAGSKLFGYAPGTTATRDIYLGFSLRYLNIDNVGDIVFENFLYTDTFLFVRDNVSQTQMISEGFARQYIDRVSFSNLIGWQPAAAQNLSRQVFRFSYANQPLILDIAISNDTVYPPLQIFDEGVYLDPTDYSYVIGENSTTITIAADLVNGTVIEVEALSDQTSPTGYYQIPLNLENNPLNENSNIFTLGTIRTHYESIGQNLRNIQGPIIGANNTRDLGDIVKYGDIIVQHSAPLALTGTFLRQQQFELFNSIGYNSREYSKYKALLLDLAANGDFENLTPTEVLDQVLQEISLGRSDISPFYWSDMLPSGEVYTTTTITYTIISSPVFDLLNTYDFTQSNYQALSVYLNGRLLTINYEYVVSADSPTLTITVPLVPGDVIVIRGYPETYGSYVPNTPTKMGLYPAFKPEIYLDTTYVNPTLVIRGHDGSITVAFSDHRDQVLLEFETRIFNNLKIVSEIPLSYADVAPGQFRTTDYTLEQVNQILVEDFLSWVGWNKLDYTSQAYTASDPFTYNYSQSSNRLTGEPALGAWRGIYNYFYDTYTPDTTPWQMLGFSQKPTWWNSEYGPGPYTSGNTVLWDDLAAGIIREPGNVRVDLRYARPQLLQVLPVGSEGELLDPLQAAIGNYDATSFKRNWVFGDDGPVENAWRTSSSWPFAVMRLLALTKPANFFSLFADRDRYVYNTALEQYLWDGRYRIDANRLTPLYGNGISKASYINWIIDYNRQLGINSTDTLTSALSNIDIRLCWRMAGFSGKNYLKVYTERATPDSTNNSLILPDESYQLLLYKDQPFEQLTYSSVIVQKTETGYAVLGYSSLDPYFEILVSRPSGNFVNLSNNGNTIRVALEHTTTVARVPYGFVFTNLGGVVDFLVSYGALLENQGFVFENRENGYVLNWLQMAQEFLYWTNQGWATGSIINLNPGATSISIERPGAVVDNLNIYSPENIILNQNRQPLKTGDLVVDRIDNLFRVSTLTTNTINFLNIRFTQYEHLMVLDNRSIFADLIYQPVTGARQSRVLIAGWLSGDWNGTVNAPGFVLNQDNIVEWVSTRKYAKGEIVLFKNEYWAASTIIQPSQNFNYNLWIKSDYNEIQRGLLPNAANVSDQLAQAYSVFDANLEAEVDLFSYGLIGFRPRQYMQALNLDDVSQVNLYQQFLGTKGTIRSAELFSLANLGKEVAEYNINEFWAILRSQYGATANRSFVEFLLNEADLHSNPSLIQVIQPGEASEADQTVLVQNIWKSTTKITSPDILPTTTELPTDVGLPVAGYVNLDDVDLTLFDFDAAQVAGAVALNQIGVNTTIWFAKINNYDWGIFRAELVPGNVISISDNLNGRSQVQFSKPHDLAVNDLIIINYFDPAINGVYRVLTVVDIQSILIEFAFTGFQSEVVGNGIVFRLQTARVAQPSDIINLPYAKQLGPGARVWVDANRSGLWEVLEKTEPFTTQTAIGPVSRIGNSQYGAALSQGFQNLSALVGAPGYNANESATAPGALYTYVKTFADVYEENSILQLGTTDVAGYGNAIDMGDQQWAVVGASASDSGAGYAAVIYRNPASPVFEQWQLLAIPAVDQITAADEFGFSVTMSLDERWLYVGAPGGNTVYAYARIDVQTQIVQYISTVGQVLYDFSNAIVVDDGSQIIVSVDNIIQTYLTDYTVFESTVTLSSVPSTGSVVSIVRRDRINATSDGVTDDYDVSSIYSVTDVYSVTVYVDGILLRPVTDYTLAGSTVTLLSVPLVDTPIVFRAGTYYSLVADLTASIGDSTNAEFGHSITTTTTGRKLLAGSPNTVVDDGETSYTNAGTTFVFDKSVQRFQVTDANVISYTTEQALVAPTAVYLNSVYQLNEVGNIGGTYTIAGNTVTFSVALAVGDIIEIETNEFNQEQLLVSTDINTGNKYGFKVDQCVNDCSLYVSSPYINLIKPQAGQVEVEINQARVFGTITSTIANPTLTPGNFLRVNNYFVEVTGTTVEELAADINAAVIPNAQANVTANLELVGDARTKIFDVGSIYSVAASYTPVVYIDDVLKVLNTDYTYNNTTKQITFVTAPPIDAVITVVSGRLIISVKNQASAVPLNKLQVDIGTGTVFSDLGMQVYVYQQTITAPVQQDFAHFGESLFISEDTVTLIVGAPNGTPISTVTFDAGTTTFDAESTTFIDTNPNAGVVYTYDALRPANWSATNPIQFVFGQQIFVNDGQALDSYGAAVDNTTGTLLIGSPGFDAGDSQVGYGAAYSLRNTNNLPAWQQTRVQQPTVDINLLNTVFMYDRASGLPKQYFDYFNPSQGRLLGAVAQNLDFTGAVDPAAYNVGPINNYGVHWSEERVGQIWWNTSSSRFINTNQDDVVYDSRRWGQLFPGSTVEIYQWIASDVPPINYAGPGTVWSTISYTINNTLNSQGIVGIVYYFWVSGLDTVSTIGNKTLSINTLAQYIESPKSSGISYIAPINGSTFAIYNGTEYVSAQDTVLHIEYDQQLNDAAVHVEYQLIPQDRDDGFLVDALYVKLQDSFCGVDAVGRPVPDPFLFPSEQYGVQARPRQSMFVNRFAALKNYLKSTNAILAQYPISETRSFNLLNSSEPEPGPGSSAWNDRVANYEELTFQDLSTVPLGYKYLVVSDINYRGLWTIYEVIAGQLPGSKTLLLIRVQNYDTRLYWNYINWYAATYNPATKLTATVPNYSALETLTVTNGAAVGVDANSQGKWEIYQYNNGTWVRVGLQDGTIEFQERLWDYTVAAGRYGFDVEVFDAQFFDQEPVIETRKIIQAINQELMVDELLIERNRLLILMFNYILSEQIAPNWLTKTSLIDVDHVIRDLVPYQIYRRDNQDFVLNYIQEVKPYHVQIREFNLIYNGFDTYQGTVNDFDLPAYWDPAQNLFISPVLDDTGNLSTTSSVPSTSTVWQTLPWNQWYQNYLLEIESVSVVDGGSGYTTAPEVVVTGTAVIPAVMTAVVNSAGEVIRIDVDDPGAGYSTTAILTLVGGNGTGARAVAVMGNGLVRNFLTTIKYDRYQYQTTVADWQANVSYDNGTLVRYANIVWSANNSDSSAVESSVFDPDQWTIVPAADLSGVDRTMGYYNPSPNEPGLDLAQLISGVDYPGVQVDAPDFNQNTGFDVGNYDINPFDNISYGPEGQPTYDPAILDAIYSSEFIDPYLGVLPTSINVDGGEFVDAYSSHAPEELVPGAIFDTLDMRVFTSPGADWTSNGHGFPLKIVKYTYSVTTTDYSFSDLVDFPVVVEVWNQTQKLQLLPAVDYTVDWIDQSISFDAGVSAGDIIVVGAYALGGGNQLYTNSYNGADIGNTIILPISYNLIENVAVFVNGVNVTAFTAAAYQTFYTRIVFSSTYTSTDYITVTALGYSSTGGDYTWSVPQTQYFIADGSTLSFTLTNSLEGTNPANLIVEKNGIRARPAEGVEYVSDGSSLQYYCPDRGGYSPATVSANEVSVYIDGQPLVLGVGYVVDVWDGLTTSRTVTLSDLPAAGSTILISVSTAAQYYLSGNTLIWKATGPLQPIAGDVISVTTFNDTDQQNILTQAFAGPTSQGVLVAEGYDDTVYDAATVSDTPGSYDYSDGALIQTNNFDTGRIITDPSRLVVTLDGLFLFEDYGFTVSGSVVTISGPILNAANIVAITSYTQSVVPGPLAFRIFQDMRGLQSTYRITAATTTVLTNSVSAVDDIIYVDNASALGQPNLPLGIFGLVTINGERIAYRNRDVVNNTISGLRRGTAGTGAASHASGSSVYDIGIGNLLPAQYQNYVVSQDFLANGTTTSFVATDISVVGLDSAELTDAVEVYVGGIRQAGGYTIDTADPVTVVFDVAPTQNYQVTILVRRALSWYEPGPTTPSNGIALQEQTTEAARFIRGE
jgi:hypothetical protein